MAESKNSIYQVRQNVMVGIILIILLSFVLILYLFVKIRNANKKLTEKVIELVHCENRPTAISNNIYSKSVTDQKKAEIIEHGNESDQGTHSDPIREKYMIARLEETVVKKELFSDPHLTLESLAELLNTNRTYLSHIINKHYGENFCSYLNELRVKKAALFISQKGEVDIYKLESIAKNVGFSNRATFNAAFKKYTGVTPSFFIKNLKQ